MIKLNGPDGRSLPSAAYGLLAGLPRTQAWRDRVAAIGHGTRREITAAEALKIARDAVPVAAPAHDHSDPMALGVGAAVIVAADDYGRDPVAGTLVAATPDRVVIARSTPDLGATHIHFPRAGYSIGKA